MITAGEACGKAITFINGGRAYGAYRLFDMADSFVVALQTKNLDATLMPVAVNKKTGKCSTYYLDSKHLEMLEKARRMTVPKEYDLWQ